MSIQRLALAAMAAAMMSACGGASTPAPDQVTPPAPGPDADVGRDRAEQEAALGSRERMQTQQRTEAQVGEQPR